MDVVYGPLGIIFFLTAIFARLLFSVSLVRSIFFLSPFFDLRAITIGSTHISPVHLVGVLLIAYTSLIKLVRMRLPMPKANEGTVLLALLGAILSSIAVPVFFAGKVNVVTMDTSYLEYGNVVPLRFRMTNVTQVLFPSFMAFLFFSIRYNLKSCDDVIAALNALFLGVFIVAISGFVIQFSLFAFGESALQAIIYLFHGQTAIDEVLARIESYNTFLGFPRMYSLAGEPSFTANLFILFLGLYIPLHFSTVKQHFALQQLRHSAWIICIVFIALIMTFSTSSYLGLFFIALSIICFSKFRVGDVKKILPVLFFGAMIFGLILYLYGDLVVSYLIENHLNKITNLSGSGTIRLVTMIYSMEIFTQFPLLGVGYGSHRSGALITTLLSNIGIIGTLMYISFVSLLVLKLRRISKLYVFDSYSLVTHAGSIALTAWIALSLVATSAVVISFTWFWIICAIMSFTSQQIESTGAR